MKQYQLISFIGGKLRVPRENYRFTASIGTKFAIITAVSSWLP